MAKKAEFWIFVFLALLIAYFGITTTAYGAVLQQTDFSTSTNANTVYQCLNCLLDDSNATSTPLFNLLGSISSITFKTNVDSDSDRYGWALLRTQSPCNSTNRFFNDFVVGENNVTFGQSGIVDKTVTFSPHTFDASRCYVLKIGSFSNSAFTSKRLGVMGNSTSFFGTGFYKDSTSGASTPFPDQSFPTNPTRSAYFLTNGSFSSPNSISITSPTNSSTVAQFENWGISYSLATTTSFYTARVFLGESSTSTPNKSCAYQAISTSTSVAEIKNSCVFEPFKQYYTYASLGELFGNEIASSSIISFNTGAIPIQGGYTFPTSTATSSEWVITCDPESSLFTKSLCNLALAIFIPKQSDFDRFSGLYNDISTKPPIGYFSIIKDAINNLSTATSTTFQLADLSSIQGSFITPLKTGISMILWFLFMFWAFSRFRHFQL